MRERSRVRFPTVSLEIFHWHNPSDRTMTLGSTHPLTEMSTRNISWRYKRPVHIADNHTIIPSSRADCLETWEPELPGILMAYSDLFYFLLHVVELLQPKNYTNSWIRDTFIVQRPLRVSSSSSVLPRCHYNSARRLIRHFMSLIIHK